jgi:hypothetical protein
MLEMNTVQDDNRKFTTGDSRRISLEDLFSNSIELSLQKKIKVKKSKTSEFCGFNFFNLKLQTRNLKNRESHNLDPLIHNLRS